MAGAQARGRAPTALLLAAAQSKNPPAEQRFDLEQARNFFDACVRLCPRHPTKAESDVLAHGQLREQQVVLIHEADVAGLWRQRSHISPSIQISPEAACCTPAITSSSWVFPAPVGPSRTKYSPSAISRLMDWSVNVPRRELTFDKRIKRLRPVLSRG